MGSASAAKVREAAAKYPEAERAFLFGDHEVFRVRGKVFLWLSDDDDGSAGFGLRLKETQTMAMSLPFVTPMAYGMAKWGWVSAAFKPKEKVPLELVLAWLDESYRNVAPKKLVAQLSGAPTPAPKKASPARKVAKKQPAKKPVRRAR